MADLSGKDLLEVLTDLGFSNDGLKGNHFVVKKGPKTVLIPDEDSLAEKTVLGIIDQAGLGSRDVLKLLRVKMGNKPIRSSLDEDQDSGPSGSNPFSRAWNTKLWAPPLALFRVLVGVMFVISALEKAPWLPTPFGWYHSFLEAVTQYPIFPFIPDLVNYIFLPNFMFWGWFQYLLEMIVGLMLIIGLFTPVFAFIGTIWVMIFWMLVAGLPSQWVWSYILWIAALVMFWSMNAGRSFGIDQAIYRFTSERKEDSWFWAFVRWFV